MLETGGFNTKRCVAIHVRDAEQTFLQQNFGPIARRIRRCSFDASKRENRTPYGISLALSAPNATRALLQEIQQFYDQHVRDVRKPDVEFRYSQPSGQIQPGRAIPGKKQLVAGFLIAVVSLGPLYLGIWLMEHNFPWLGGIIGLAGGLLVSVAIGLLNQFVQESQRRGNSG